MDADRLHGELAEQGRALRSEIPEVYAAVARLHAAAMGDGALDRSTKELVALGIAVAKGCEGCIEAHVRTLVRLGATRAEIAEVAGVAIVMDGGPATVWGPRALEVFDQLAGG